MSAAETKKERLMETSRIPAYLHSLENDGSPLLEELREYARANDVPIVRRETESFLRTVCAAKRPVQVLEIGTAIAYSTIVLSEYADHITTMENYEKRIPLAKENLKRAGIEDRTVLMEGDAGESLKELLREGKKYDLVFLDAAKAQYLIWLPDILALMREGSILLADNVLQDETVMESRFTVDRRDRTTHERMREFLYRIKHDERLETAVLPLGDGVSFSVFLNP